MSKGYAKYSFAGPIKKVAKIFKFGDIELYGSEKDKLIENKNWVYNRSCNYLGLKYVKIYYQILYL